MGEEVKKVGNQVQEEETKIADDGTPCLDAHQPGRPRQPERPSRISAAPNPAVVLLIGFVCCGSRILVDQLALLAYPWCDHPTKCYDYAEELAASVDPSVDPCDNLYEHVCAHWSRRYPAFPGQFHLLQTRAAVFVLRQLERAAPQHPSLAVRRTVSGYQACRGAFDDQREDAQVLFDVFDQFNVTWPAWTLPENFDVMEYLLGLSLDYGLETPLLLSLRPYLPTDRRYGFSLDFVLGRDGTAYEPAQVAACMPSVAPSVGRDSALQFGDDHSRRARGPGGPPGCRLPGSEPRPRHHRKPGQRHRTASGARRPAERHQQAPAEEHDGSKGRESACLQQNGLRAERDAENRQAIALRASRAVQRLEHRREKQCRDVVVAVDLHVREGA
ncbi:endothelin-converting enzyme 2-like [Dermacentor albipictus]|uniref:endothelin-converting enzyme 2-like n=1 Tax=Dermacentor albipictus TaxID=60249 RepID=UPI0031FD4FBC